MIRPTDGQTFSLQVTAAWLDEQKRSLLTSDRLREAALESAEGPLQQSIEKAVTLQELHGPDTEGLYFSLTDRSLPPEEYKYLTQGVTKTGELLITFTFLYRESPSPQMAQAIEAIRGASHYR